MNALSLLVGQQEQRLDQLAKVRVRTEKQERRALFQKIDKACFRPVRPPVGVRESLPHELWRPPQINTRGTEPKYKGLELLSALREQARTDTASARAARAEHERELERTRRARVREAIRKSLTQQTEPPRVDTRTREERLAAYFAELDAVKARNVRPSRPRVVADEDSE